MSIKSLALAIAKAFLDFILKPVLRLGWRTYYFSLDHTKPLPKTDNPLLFMPAWQLAQKIRKREITSLSLVQAYIDRIKEIQPYLNFMVSDCFDEAIEQAKRVDEILSSSSIPDAFSEAKAPLLGIPFSCKESLWVKDKPNSTGLIKRKNFRAPEDAFVVKYMRQAGAIMTCMTNTSELCMWFETSNYLYGTTRNPYNLSRIVGGSSGGEGCIVGSGASVVGLGSDIGGSIRIPSYFNGVYGHMPTPNLISNDYQYPTGLQQAMLSTGPICRYASDLKLMVKTLIGPKYSEIAHMFETKVEPQNLKFYVINDLQGHLLVTEPDSDARKALNKAVKFVEEELGQKVEEIRPKLLSKAFEMWSSFVHEGKVGKRWFCRTLNNDPQNPINAFNQLLKSIIGQQREHTLPSILIALKEQLGIYEDEKFIKVGDQFREEMKELLGQDGVLIFPSFPSVAPYHNLAAFHNNFDFIYFGIINVLGFPSTQCPMGLNAEGLPTGVQIVSNRFNDHITISLAELFEQKLGGWVAPF